MYYLLFYDVVDDYMTRRVPLRAEHLGLARSALERGELVMGGALANPPDAAILVFKGDSAQVVEDFVRADPYVREGVVKSWRIREWTVVIGDGVTPP
ncbi:MAG: YciI family protein [Deltaproteobacteria bacterium]|nr:YciI family protein [Deltaproteobacteria bacterium]